MKMNAHVFNLGSMYRPILSFSKRVMPGESINLDLKGTLESDVVANLRSPALVSSYAFYVPHRLVWSGFTEFVSNADTVATAPLTASTFPEAGEITNTNFALFRRSIKLAYNTFFGDEDYGPTAEAFYADPLSDNTANTMYRLKAVNQLLANIALDVDEPADNYAVVANNIEMTEFRRRLKVNSRQNNQRIGGEKYTDALRRFGVQVRDEFISQPEMFYSASEVVYPQEVFNTSETGTGNRVGRYRVALSVNPKRIFCQEHGYVFVLHALRPFLGNVRPPLERACSTRRFFMEEAEKPFVEIASLNLGTATDVEPDPLVPAYGPLNLGDMHAFNGVTGVLAPAANATMAALVYPQVAGDPKVNIGISCRCTFETPTP